MVALSVAIRYNVENAIRMQFDLFKLFPKLSLCLSLFEGILKNIENISF